MKYCPFCGAGLHDDMIFCPNCGKKYQGPIGTNPIKNIEEEQLSEPSEKQESFSATKSAVNEIASQMSATSKKQKRSSEEQQLSKLLKRKAIGKITYFFILFLIFAGIASGCVFYGISDGIEVGLLVGALLTGAAAVLFLFAIIKSRKSISNPLEEEPISSVLHTGTSCGDILNVYNNPTKSIMGINLGSCFLTDSDNIEHTFLYTNVVKIYISIHTTNLVTDRMALSVEDKSGSTINKWQQCSVYSKKETEARILSAISELKPYCPHAVVGFK